VKNEKREARLESLGKEEGETKKMKTSEIERAESEK
jgi:hypothetical protein